MYDPSIHQSYGRRTLAADFTIKRSDEVWPTEKIYIAKDKDDGWPVPGVKQALKWRVAGRIMQFVLAQNSKAAVLERALCTGTIRRAVHRLRSTPRRSSLMPNLFF